MAMDVILNDELVKQLADNSYLFAGNAAFIEDLYAQFLKDPESVGADWRRTFAALQRSAPTAPADADHRAIRASFARLLQNSTSAP